MDGKEGHKNVEQRSNSGSPVLLEILSLTTNSYICKTFVHKWRFYMTSSVLKDIHPYANEAPKLNFAT